jgi:hypothetical protein
VHDPLGSSALRNPARIKPKGRPSEKEKRRKPLVELREKANKKRRKNAPEPKKKKEVVVKTKRAARPKKFPYFGDEGNSVKEWECMALAKQMNAMKDAGIELKL